MSLGPRVQSQTSTPSTPSLSSDTPREGAGQHRTPLSSKITHRGEADRIRERPPR